MRRSPRIATAALLAALALAAAGCEKDDEEEEAADPGTSRQTQTSVSYLEARFDGLYCVGYQDARGSFILEEPRLWFAYPFVQGETYGAGGCAGAATVTVAEIHGSFPTPIGRFTDVATIRQTGCVRETFLQEGWGILGWAAPGCGSGSGYAYTVDAISIARGADPLAVRFGLATGSTWRYRLSGFDAQGKTLTGETTRTVQGTTTIEGHFVYVVEEVAWSQAGSDDAPVFRWPRLVP